MEERARIPVGPPVSNPLPSYWQSPKSPLATVDHVKDSSQPYDYVIIGSGISGAMIAYNLLKLRPNALVLMLEARELCNGATGRNGGHTKAASYRSYLSHVASLGKFEALKIARLEFDNIVETHRLARELQIDCESEMCKTVDVIYGSETFEQGKKAIMALRQDASDDEKRAGSMAWYVIHENVETVSTQFHVSTQNENPAVTGDERVTGAFEYMAGRINAYRFTTGVLAECMNKGLEICTNTPVHSINPSDHAGAKWQVSTPRDTFLARNVVLATNAYTPYLAPSLQGAVVPMRGQITAQQPGAASRIETRLPTTYSFIGASGYEYLVPRPLSAGHQHLIVGGGLGRLPACGDAEFGTIDDSALNAAVTSYLRGCLLGYFGAANWGEADPRSAEHRVVSEWTGIMGATADGRPFVGPIAVSSQPSRYGAVDEAGAATAAGPQNTVWVSAGFNGHGMVLCFKAAQAIVQMMECPTESLDWFPASFLVSAARLASCQFKGRTDLPSSVQDAK